VHERLALGFGSSSFRYAAPAGRDWTIADLAGKRIATAYPNLVRKDLRDKGIDAKVPAEFWETIRDEMRAYLAKNEFGAGLAHGVKRTGEVLAGFFPYQAGDVNELSNEISFGL
jgi:hypothetical protein